jgi:hypothetical protein
MSFFRFRTIIFLSIGSAELIVAILLVMLGRNLPHESQIATTFAQARSTGKRAVYTADLFEETLKKLQRIPLAGQVVPVEWIQGMAQARKDLAAAVGDLNTYERQVRFSVSTTKWIILLVGAVVALHGIYLMLASWYGKAYSP